MIPRLIDPATAAAILDVRPAQIWRWVRSKKLKAFRLGRGRRARIRIAEADLLAFLGGEPENPSPSTASLPAGTVPGGSMSRQEARDYVTRAMRRGLLT